MDTRRLRIPTWRIRAKLESLRWSQQTGTPYSPFLAVKALR